jgi:hypothetical protein
VIEMTLPEIASQIESDASTMILQESTEHGRYDPNDRAFSGEHVGEIVGLIRDRDLAYVVSRDADPVHAMFQLSDFPRIARRLIEHQNIKFQIDELGQVVDVQIR